MLQARNITKRFGAKTAVDGASFDVPNAQMIGIIGRSGAGKSTLLRVMNRLTEAGEGSLIVEGRDVLSLTGRAKRDWQSNCAMVFQQFNLVPRLDVLTNVMLGRLRHHSALGAMMRLFTRAERLAAFEALDRLGIADHASKRAQALSGGQQQRVAIARALMQNPKIVLADEPIASLDPMNARTVMDALRRIHVEDGRTVICNLHTLDTAREYCERVIGMRDGRIVFDGPSDTLDAATVREIYGARDDLDEGTTSTAMPRSAAPASRAAIAAAE